MALASSISAATLAKALSGMIYLYLKKIKLNMLTKNISKIKQDLQSEIKYLINSPKKLL